MKRRPPGLRTVRFAPLLCALSVVLADGSTARAVEAIGPASGTPAAVQRMLKRHHLAPDQLEAWRVPTFADVLVFTLEAPDAGPFFQGALVHGRWIERTSSERDGGAWSKLGHAALLSRHWTKLDTPARLSLARDWVINGQLPGASVRTQAEGYPITVRLDGPDLLVYAWVDEVHESGMGPRAIPATGVTTYRFHADGRIDVEAAH